MVAMEPRPNVAVCLQRAVDQVIGEKQPGGTLLLCWVCAISGLLLCACPSLCLSVVVGLIYGGVCCENSLCYRLRSHLSG